MTASLLPIPDDPRFHALVASWNESNYYAQFSFPRSVWLRDFEHELRRYYPPPLVNSASRKLTARHYAPFFLAAGHDVP